jgi:hypothetical protein
MPKALKPIPKPGYPRALFWTGISSIRASVTCGWNSWGWRPVNSRKQGYGIPHATRFAINLAQLRKLAILTPMLEKDPDNWRANSLRLL